MFFNFFEPQIKPQGRLLPTKLTIITLVVIKILWPFQVFTVFCCYLVVKAVVIKYGNVFELFTTCSWEFLITIIVIGQLLSFLFLFFSFLFTHAALVFQGHKLLYNLSICFQMTGPLMLRNSCNIIRCMLSFDKCFKVSS